METMRVQHVTPNDMPWKIKYDASRCTLCGSCVSACSFRAIEAKVERRRMVFSEGELPDPQQRFSAVPVIRQVKTSGTTAVAAESAKRSALTMPSPRNVTRIPGIRLSPVAWVVIRSSAADGKTSKPRHAPLTSFGWDAFRR